MTEEYFAAERLLELHIGAVITIIEERTGEHMTARLVGVDKGRCVITSIPQRQADGSELALKSLLNPQAQYELKTIHEGRVVAWEARFKGTAMGNLLFTSFPEMIETRRLRLDTRFPCVLACDIDISGEESYGMINNISAGGCQITVKQHDRPELIKEKFEKKHGIKLRVFFPPSDEPMEVEVTVQSVQASENGSNDGNWQFGLAFRYNYEEVRMYLESLQLDAVASFFR